VTPVLPISYYPLSLRVMVLLVCCQVAIVAGGKHSTNPSFRDRVPWPILLQYLFATLEEDLIFDRSSLKKETVKTKK
jgi:hypothetical protein